MKTVVWCVARETSPWNRIGNVGKPHIWLPNSSWKRHYSAVGKGVLEGIIGQWILPNEGQHAIQWNSLKAIGRTAGHHFTSDCIAEVWLGNFLTTVKDFWTWNDQTLIQNQMCNEHKMFVKGFICVHFVWHLQRLKHLGSFETDLEYEWHCFLWDTLSFFILKEIS